MDRIQYVRIIIHVQDTLPQQGSESIERDTLDHKHRYYKPEYLRLYCTIVKDVGLEYRRLCRTEVI